MVLVINDKRLVITYDIHTRFDILYYHITTQNWK